MHLEEELRIFFYDELYKLYRIANETKNNYKKLQLYNEEVKKLEEKNTKGFVDKKELIRIETSVEEARKKKDIAKKKLDKIEASLYNNSQLTPLQRVQNKIKDKFEKKNVSTNTKKAEKKETEIIAKKDNKKTRYFTENLSKLDKNKRKLVGQIMGIVSQIAPENITKEIQEAIEKEFR